MVGVAGNLPLDAHLECRCVADAPFIINLTRMMMDQNHQGTLNTKISTIGGASSNGSEY